MCTEKHEGCQSLLKPGRNMHHFVERVPLDVLIQPSLVSSQHCDPGPSGDAATSPPMLGLAWVAQKPRSMAEPSPKSGGSGACQRKRNKGTSCSGEDQSTASCTLCGGQGPTTAYNQNHCAPTHLLQRRGRTAAPACSVSPPQGRDAGQPIESSTFRFTTLPTGHMQLLQLTAVPSQGREHEAGDTGRIEMWPRTAADSWIQRLPKAAASVSHPGGLTWDFPPSPPCSASQAEQLVSMTCLRTSPRHLLLQGSPRGLWIVEQFRQMRSKYSPAITCAAESNWAAAGAGCTDHLLCLRHGPAAEWARWQGAHVLCPTQLHKAVA